MSGVYISLVSASVLASEGVVETYASHPKTAEFAQLMSDKHGFDQDYIKNILAKAEKKQSIIDAISRPAERTKAWFEYREIFLGEKRITQGVEFWNENADVLAKASEDYGVEPEIIVAIVGVETRYGSYMGSYRVVDALATLGFDYPPRAKFFSGQLEELFLLAREQKQDPLSLKGSYAGAMGYGQFIPSSYRSFARDNTGDGFADIWNNKSDAIGSIANYFQEHGWQKGQPVLERATLAYFHPDGFFNARSRPKSTLSEYKSKGLTLRQAEVPEDTKAVALRYQQQGKYEYWFGFNNFYAITRYNRSRLYARAVWELSQEIKQRREQYLSKS